MNDCLKVINKNEANINNILVNNKLPKKYINNRLKIKLINTTLLKIKLINTFIDNKSLNTKLIKKY